MKQRITLSFLLILLTGIVHSQPVSEALKETFSDAEYFLVQEYYSDALAEYIKIYKRGFSDNANINYRIGICYLNIPGQKKEAIPYLQKASSNTTATYIEGSLKETKAPYDVFLYLGNAYRVTNDLDKAITAYQKYIDLLKGKESEMTKYAEQQIITCNNAKEQEKNPVPIKKINLGPVINNKEANYKPVISNDENTLVFMNHLKFYDAVYMSKKVNGQWTAPENLTPQIISDGDQFACFITYDGNTLYLTKEDRFNSDLVESHYENGKWTPSKPLNKNINTKFWESHASVTADGKTLYFASNRSGGEGEMDIYKSEKQDNGQWGPAINLGPVINTKLNDDCPFISPDGKTLFFSSQGHYNMGGYDLFKSTLNAKGEWETPKNLGYPVNTTDDDVFFFPVENGKAGYIALFEKGGYGDDDIYRIEFLTEEKKPVPGEITVSPVDTAKIIVTVPDTTKKVVEEESPVTEAPFTEKLTIHPVLFGFNQTSLTAETQQVLDHLLKALKANPDMGIELIGHTDSKGSDDYNIALARKRAEIAKLFLVNRGINDKRIKVTSMGERRPVALNSNPDGTDNPEGRKFNRRVEFRITVGDNGLLIIERLMVPEKIKIK